MSEDSFLVVLCTVPTPQAGAEIARALVSQRLAACVNLIGGVQSFYEWEGSLHEDAECQLVIKTRQSRFASLHDWLKANHPYEEPEILALPVVGGSRSYLDWVQRQTTPSS